jgi:hypothetical protein
MSFNLRKFTPNNTITNIELIERNVEELDKSKFKTTKFFLRTGRPGRLFLKPNYTAFTKTNLGSIPSKLEKTLVKTDSNKPLSTFVNNTLTSFNDSKDFEKIKKEEKDIRNYTTSFSSKGYGVGFLSKVNRFGENLSGYLPGPTDYSPDKYMTLLSNVEKSPFGKSLFKKKTSASLSTASNDNVTKSRQSKTSNKQKRTFTNVKDEFSSDKKDSENKKGSYFFSSTSDRFNGNIFTGKNLNPGPGKYFFINDNIRVKYPDNLSPEFVLPSEKKINPIHYFGLNENDKKKFGFHLINKMKKKKYISMWNKSKNSFEENLFNKYNKSNISLANNSTRLTSLTNNNNSSKMASLYYKENLSKMYNNSIKTEYISLVSDNKNNSLNSSTEEDKNKEVRNKNEKKKRSKPRRRDNFSLSPPRWDEGYFHDNDSHFQVPGPAYYAPPIQNNKKSFNLNNKDFIFTNSLPFKIDNYGTISSVLI